MQKFYTVSFLTLILALAAGISAAQTSTTSPQTQPPAAQAQSNSSANSQAPHQGQSIDDELQLTPDQKEKIAAVVDDENKQIGTVRDDKSMSMEQKQQKATQIRQDGATKIKAVLTAEQLQKLAVIQERNRQQQPAQSSPNSSQPPQR